ncbi:HD domain-containing protein [Mucilaginibacter dorajii]|uniref:HD/PDEase domain-containing protein n=1 Tax=Mucilaginibacter dorajii TaxID=692994 RepID=A0ABP7P279_9SPHI|nr:HD domain-containing protein [Mucilaginibacter dorajii]MCS3737027.1 putative metal-dependent HD superfamily phosphohydrolase [Mucilaginibacter dorajii]
MHIEQARQFILDKLNTQLAAQYHYHNATHAEDVYTAAKQIALGEGISAQDTCLLLTAALFHDSGLLLGADEHEKKSCEVASEFLPAFGYTDEEIARICDIIMATKMPQSPQDKLGEIICDADLDYLGRNDFFILSKRLFSELEITHSLQTEAEWDKQQVSFLESHHYFTQTAIALRGAEKERHLKIIIDRLK